ncbi:hypothetical protein [Soonwooa sp.]|uniref:hypothetical protein n=1 Tax=Soonwooa sp. TaxID=1938592 RepID=UPI00261F434E|nr:hypothetical protein [Soonwooa sp.]
MKTNICLVLFLVFASCKNDESKNKSVSQQNAGQNVDEKTHQNSDKNENSISTDKLSEDNSASLFNKMKDESFVVSCGTGCALTYNIKNITELDVNTIKVTFNIDNYINEELTESFDETYLFHRENSKLIERLTAENKKENLGKITLSGVFLSFQEFGKKLFH